ncbi:MAG: hypothetical protein HQ596_00850 [Candidatus Saganbacteria bacterium]|nr:hypothetical protein [Candidatus Saganbacteria bacterium]
MQDKQLYEKGIEQADRSYAIFENILFVITLLTGYSAMTPVRLYGIPIVSLLYMLFLLVMLLLVLRKHLCTNCYYYGKWCHCGWGKLSAAIYKRNSGNQALGGKLGLLTWGTFMALPIFVMIAIVIFDKSMFMRELLYFIPFVILVIINMLMHKKDCEECKMRFTCPGSAAKT